MAWPQSADDVLEASKLGLVEKLFETMAPRLRPELASRGLSDEEVDSILFDAFDAYSDCVLAAARQQALEQGLPEDIILKGIGGRTRGKEESKILLELDMDALRVKQAPCNAQITEATGVQIR